ncbi:hypothetical protein V8C40DRAFT_129147 [Trichoderma camerunense]
MGGAEMAGCRVTGVQAVTGAWESAICAVRIPSEKKPRDAMTMWRADERRCEPRDGMNLYGRALHCTARFIISLSGVQSALAERACTSMNGWGEVVRGRIMGQDDLLTAGAGLGCDCFFSFLPSREGRCSESRCNATCAGEKVREGGIEREGCNKGDGGTESLLLTKGSGVLYQVEVGSRLPVCELRRGSRQKTVGWIIVRVSYVFDTIHGQLTGKSFGLFDRSLNALCLFVHKACM